MNRPDTATSDNFLRGCAYGLAICLPFWAALAAWLGFPWEAFAQPFPVLP